MEAGAAAGAAAGPVPAAAGDGAGSISNAEPAAAGLICTVGADTDGGRDPPMAGNTAWPIGDVSPPMAIDDVDAETPRPPESDMPPDPPSPLRLLVLLRRGPSAIAGISEDEGGRAWSADPGGTP